MRLLISFAIILFLFIPQLFASVEDSSVFDPKLEVQTSRFVNMLNSSLQFENSLATFYGNFTVSGEGIYGHFDAFVYNGSDFLVSKVRSDDRAWRRDQGGKIKNISFTIGSIPLNSKVVISFHETRIDPKNGACTTE
jgi:hypothetical protein